MTRRPMMTAIRTRWTMLAIAAIAGTISYWLASETGARAGLSFLGGLGMVVLAFEFGAFNIRLAGRLSPHLTMMVALLSYATTAIALALVLAASSPRVVVGAAVAVGLFTGLAVWIATELVASRVRDEDAQQPVSMAPQDGKSSSH